MAVRRRERSRTGLCKAAEWYQKAAHAGNISAQNNMGWLYEEGKGVERDYGKAADWYPMAAHAGDLSAQNVLGWLYEEGKGVEQDYAKPPNGIKRPRMLVIYPLKKIWDACTKKGKE